MSPVEGQEGAFGQARAEDVADALALAREKALGTAVGARADLAALRRAYLDLLKLAICDLVGPTTLTVSGTAQGTVVARELRGPLRSLRMIGFDWPYNALSMAGLLRLDDLEQCVKTIVSEDVEGDLLEAGVWRGGAALLMRAALAAYGGDQQRTVVLADSFRGFTRDDQTNVRSADTNHHGLEQILRDYEFLAVSRPEVEQTLARLGYKEGFEFIEGFFEDTMQSLKGERRWSLIRLDGDTYSATRACLDALYDDLVDGGFVIIDDYRFVEECRRAVDEFREKRGIKDPLVSVDWTCVRWRKGSGAKPAVPDSDSVTEQSAHERRAGRPGSGVSTEHVGTNDDLAEILDDEGRVRLAPTPAIATAREAELAERLRGHEEWIRETEGWLRAAGDRVASLTAEVNMLRERVGALQHACASYENSLSWRLTRPLRKAASIVRGLTGKKR
ncbi:class I SAM-dependent methyltransferase [Thermoleophilum album]|jgi:O-methyltransferase|nr:TylF/MycF/NovP-related O-methyltransferase [Thermoleophilum album]WDT94141.1 class I SAM-dependent methyltransferase [Thermoleophilum album]